MELRLGAILSASVFFLMFMGSASAQPYEPGENSAREYVRRLGRIPKFKFIETVASLAKLDAEGEDYSISVDTESGQLLSWIDKSLANDPQGGSQDPISTEQAWQASEAWARTLAIALPQRGRWSHRQRDGKESGYRLEFGDSTATDAQRVIFEVNGLTGHVVSVTRPLKKIASGPLSGTTPTTEALRGEEKAREYVRRLGHSANFKSVSMNKSLAALEVQGEDFSIGVDESSGELTFWANTAPAADPREDRSKELIPLDQAWIMAEDWARKAEIDLHTRDRWSYRKSDGKTFGYHLRFVEHPIANSGRGSVNQASFEINGYTGEVVSAIRVVGMTYLAPPSNLAKEEEIEKTFAGAVKRVYEGDLVEFHIVGQGYDRPGSDADGELADPRRPKLFPNKTAALAFFVTGKVKKGDKTFEISGSVDAAGTMVWSGGLLKSTASSALSPVSRGAELKAPALQSAASHPFSKAAIASIAAALVGFGLATLGIRRKLRN
jgi:hypothetical protein